MYFLDGILTEPQRISLTEAGVEFSETRIGTDSFHRHGIFLADESVLEAVKTLGVLYNPNSPDSNLLCDPVTDLVYRDENGTGCHLVPTFPRPTPADPVFLECRSIQRDRFSRFDNMSDYADMLRKTLESSYGDVGLEMFVHYPGRSTAVFSNAAGLLHINITSAPDGMRSDRVRTYDDPRFITRVIGNTRDYFVVRNASGRYIAMFQGDMTGGSLWLLFDPKDCDDPAEVTGYVMYSLARHLHPELGADEGIVAYRASSARRRYVALARDRMRAELAALPENATRAADLASQALDQYTAAARQQELARRRLTEEVDEAALLSQLTTQMEREFEALNASPDFTSIVFGANELSVTTRPLLLVHGGREYELGRYQFIVADRNGLTNVHVNGLDNQGNGIYCHPHVNGDRPCFGNQGENFARLMGTRQYGVLLPLIVMYLERGYQPTDSYMHIEDFHFTSRSLTEAS